MKFSRMNHVFASGPRMSRSMIESLESRELLSVSPAIQIPPGHSDGGLVGLFDHLDRRHNVKTTLPISVTNVTLNNGQLTANGLIGNQPFTAPVTLSLEPATPAANGQVTPAATTQILNLHLGPINLNLLGLQVKTSPICLDISAVSGPGNLLGNLLTDISNLLNGGTSLGTILGNPTGSQLTTLLNGLTGLLNGVLGQLGQPSSLGTAAGTVGQAANTTNILHLALGPIDLNLLGLHVHADNCSNGPITLDVNAVSGPGNLLGNLLTGLSNSLNGLNNQQLAHTILINTIRDILQLA